MNPAAAGLQIRLIDGTVVVVPHDLGQITPYVLIEQQDWFEDEIVSYGGTSFLARGPWMSVRISAAMR